MQQRELNTVTADDVGHSKQRGESTLTRNPTNSENAQSHASECSQTKLSAKEFSWEDYLTATGCTAAPSSCFFQDPSNPVNDFEIGMKLEVPDPRGKKTLKKSSNLHSESNEVLCLATIVSVHSVWICVRLDGEDGSNDQWIICDDDRLKPVGSCEKNGGSLQPPFGFMHSLAGFHKFLEHQLKWDPNVEEDPVAPTWCFHPISRAFHPGRNRFELGMKCEAIDYRNFNGRPCPATIVAINDDRVTVTFDGWNHAYDTVQKYDSRHLFPVGWSERNGIQLQPPRMTKGEIKQPIINREALVVLAKPKPVPATKRKSMGSSVRRPAVKKRKGRSSFLKQSVRSPEDTEISKDNVELNVPLVSSAVPQIEVTSKLGRSSVLTKAEVIVSDAQVSSELGNKVIELGKPSPESIEEESVAGISMCNSIAVSVEPQSVTAVRQTAVSTLVSDSSTSIRPSSKSLCPRAKKTMPLLSETSASLKQKTVVENWYFGHDKTANHVTKIAEGINNSRQQSTNSTSSYESGLTPKTLHKQVRQGDLALSSTDTIISSENNRMTVYINRNCHCSPLLDSKLVHGLNRQYGPRLFHHVYREVIQQLVNCAAQPQTVFCKLDSASTRVLCVTCDWNETTHVRAIPIPKSTVEAWKILKSFVNRLNVCPNLVSHQTIPCTRCVSPNEDVVSTTAGPGSHVMSLQDSDSGDSNEYEEIYSAPIPLVNWSVEHLAAEIRSRFDASIAEKFVQNQIDGKAVVLLSTELLIRHMDMAFGPALKIISFIDTLRKKYI